MPPEPLGPEVADRSSHIRMTTDPAPPDAAPDDAATAAVDGYLAAWNLADGSARLDLLARVLAPQARFEGPTGSFVGPDAISGLITGLRSRLGGARVLRTGPLTAQPSTHSDLGSRCYRFGWRVERAGGDTLMGGTDEVEIDDDGRLVVISVVL
ncbi:MAG: nuclear transport factor 2 family protein [Acidimicrobiales bacterium]